MPQVAARFEQVFQDERDCFLSICGKQEDFFDKVMANRPKLLLINFNFFETGLNKALNRIRHLDPTMRVIVYLCPPSTDIKTELICAGATQCLEASDGFDFLVGESKKALIDIFDHDCFADMIQISEEKHEFPELIFSLDRDGKILYTSSSIHYLLGYEDDELVGQDICDLVPSGSQSLKLKQYLTELNDSSSFNEVLALRTTLGLEEEFRVKANFMEDGIVCGTAKKIGPGPSSEEFLEAQKGEVIEQDEYTKVINEAEDQNEPIPSRLGPYRVLSLLGEGSMGRVYKGFDEHLERYVAIKMVNSTLAANPEDIEGFRREARILASISHPNIALIYYFDICDNVPFFCMEYLPEGSVDSLLRQNKVLEPRTAISFVEQVALGLKKAQEKGVIHLDVKPSNLMVAEKNRIKIVDFGLASTHSESNSDLIVGTPSYLAPEQINSGSIDHRCDIYSLGITFFEMLYGFLPFSGANVKEIFAKKLTENLPAIQLLNATVPTKLYDLIVQMTARDPEKRIQNYDELLEKLEKVNDSFARRSFSIRRTREKHFRLRGNLHVTPFAEVLAQVWKEKLTGRLTVSWLDLNKVIHFKEGIVTAVLSSQEGERFIDLLISEKQLKPETAWRIRTAPSDLFTKFSSAMSLIAPESRELLKSEFESLSFKIMENLFGWAAGDYLFEEGEYPEQGHIRIRTDELILRGVRQHADLGLILKTIRNGKINVRLSENSHLALPNLKMNASEKLLLQKIEGGISFPELHKESDLPMEQVSRLVYGFHCLGLTSFEEVQESRPKPRPEVVPMPTALTNTPANLPNLAEEFSRKAADEYYQGNFWAAVQNCKKALEFKQDYRFYHLMGKALSKHPGFKYDAMTALKQALELHPNDFTVLKDMADLYLSSGNNLMALSMYRKALAIKPSDDHCKSRMKEIERSNDFGRKIVKRLGMLFNGKAKKTRPDAKL